ncbi:UNKNOWN [Stylonychia lemnae]|uniref:EamA domain-containing protein n=1 Tax=Stylonychia lemnae TaxID=5949 RepID=A0A078B800_STYLE|nr:UNKNOWN [Stylonychia lemnae]|eukprot:CDW90529.1 UNKNOWN [Stylonychia lemnae]
MILGQKNHELNQPLLSFSFSNSEKKNETQNDVIARFFSKYYLYTAMIVGVCYGSYNFLLYLAVGQTFELRIVFLNQMANLTFFLSFQSISAIINKKRNGSFWLKQTSCYYDEEGKYDWRVLTIVTGRSISQIVSITLLYFTLEASLKSGVNNSIILSIYGAASIFTAIAFYFIFNEKLGVRHIVGIMLMTFSLILIASGKYQVNEQVQLRTGITEETKLSVFVPIVLAILNCFAFVAGSYYSRQMKTTKLSIFQYTADSAAFISILFSILALVYHFNYKPYTSEQFKLVALSSCCQVIGQIFFVGSGAYGNGGLVQAMIQVSAPYQMLLEIFVLNQYPTLMGVAGMGCCIGATVYIILSNK